MINMIMIFSKRPTDFTKLSIQDYIEVFSGDQACKYVATMQRFRDSLCLHLIPSTLKMEAERVSETLECYSVLTRLISREDFIEFSGSESFKSYSGLRLFNLIKIL
jgi:hypothetical protein